MKQKWKYYKQTGTFGHKLLYRVDPSGKIYERHGGIMHSGWHQIDGMTRALLGIVIEEATPLSETDAFILML